MAIKYKTTKDIKVPKTLISQVLGQDEAVEVVKKAAEQRRHVLLIGEPGTGKSMIGLGLAEMLPKEKLVDVISFPNLNDENQPLIRTMPGGKGRELVLKARLQSMNMFKSQNLIFFILLILAMFAPWWARSYYKSDIIFAAFFIGAMIFLGSFVLFINLSKRTSERVSIPKVIVDNYKRKNAPFFDATGAHAGALLGDVLHDPFQTFSYTSIVNCISKKGVKSESIHRPLDKCWRKAFKYKKAGNYEAIFLPVNELRVIGSLGKKVSGVEVMSSNRYDYDGEVVKIVSSSGKEVVVTPEHKIAVEKNGEIAYIEAQRLKKGDSLFALDQDTIIDKEDIINTFYKSQQKQAQLYYKYLEAKRKNPSWGYKKIAKSLGLGYHKTRWWHAKKHVPLAVQTVQWLENRRMIPLTYDNERLPLIAKILGATYGDGGIFQNLNGIFLSSKERINVEEFGHDLEKIFGLEKKENSRIIKAGEYGNSFCYQNTKRNIIRFFIALKSPVGKKSDQELSTPAWIYKKKELMHEFFGSLFGSEIGIPKIHVCGTHLNTFDIAITGKNLEKNRRDFFDEIKYYLKLNDVRSLKLSTRKIDEHSKLYRLLISNDLGNIIQFSKSCKINYCAYKKEKLQNSIEGFKKIKLRRYHELISRGHGAERAMNILNVSPETIYQILNECAESEV